MKKLLLIACVGYALVAPLMADITVTATLYEQPDSAKPLLSTKLEIPEASDLANTGLPEAIIELVRNLAEQGPAKYSGRLELRGPRELWNWMIERDLEQKSFLIKSWTLEQPWQEGREIASGSNTRLEKVFRWDVANKLVQERYYVADGKTIRYTKTRTWQGERLLNESQFDADSKEMWSLNYRYSPAGVFLGTTRTGENAKITNYFWQDGIVRELVEEDDTSFTLVTFDTLSRSLRSEVYRQDVLIQLVRMIYSSSTSGTLQETYEFNSDTEILTWRRFDAGGREAEEIRYRIGRDLGAKHLESAIVTLSQVRTALPVRSRLIWAYTSDSRVSVKELWDAKGRTRTEFSYTNTGVTERTITNGQLSLEILRSGEETVITRYGQGQAVLRLYEKNGIRVREEDLQGGKVIATRTYQ